MDHVIKRLQWHESIKQHAAETQYIAHYYKFTPLQFCYEIFLVKRRLGQKKKKTTKTKPSVNDANNAHNSNEGGKHENRNKEQGTESETGY